MRSVGHVAAAGGELRMRHALGLVAALCVTTAFGASGCSGGETPADALDAAAGGAAGSGGTTAGAAGEAGTRDAGTGGHAGTGQARDASKTEGGDSGAEGGTQRRRVTVRAAPVDAVWAAFQDGSNPWQRLLGSQGVYTFDVAGDRYSVAVVCADSADANTFVRVVHATLDELTELPIDCSAYAPQTMYHVTGAVGGIIGASYAAVTVGSSYVSFTSPVSAPTYDVTVSPDTYDVLAFRATGSSSSDFAFEHMVIDRNVVVTGDLAHDVDLAQGGFPASGSAHVDVLGVEAGEQASVGIRYRTSGGTNALIAETQSASLDYPVIPTAARLPGDLYYVSGFAVVMQGATYTSRGTTRFLATPALVGQTLPPAFKPMATRMGSTPYVRVHVTLPEAAWASNLDLEYTATQGATRKSWSTVITTGWLSGATSYDMPDLSTLPGWTPDWGLIGGTTQVDADLGAYFYSRGYSASLAPQNDGDVQRNARFHTVL